VNVRSYEDFIAVSIIGTGNVSIGMETEKVALQVGGLSKYTGYLIIAGLLGAVIYLEGRLE